MLKFARMQTQRINQRPRGKPISKEILVLALLVLATPLVFFLAADVSASEIRYGQASWYSVESCKREGTSGIMANGEVLDDNKLICAIWGIPFGTRIRVVNASNSKSVVVRVADRGPAKRLVKRGRIIDLSKGAFGQIADLKQGLIQVRIEILEDND